MTLLLRTLDGLVRSIRRVQRGENKAWSGRQRVGNGADHEGNGPDAAPMIPVHYVFPSFGLSGIQQRLDFF